MSVPLNRRQFLWAGATTGLLAGASRLGSSPTASAEEPGRERKFTMDLVCGALGVRADLPEAIALAHRFGFESVAPDASYLVRLDEGRLRDLPAELKSQGLVWGAAGLPVD